TPVGGLGVAYEPGRDVLYVSYCQFGCARLNEGLVEMVDPTTGTGGGVLFRELRFATGGLGYDPTTDALWMGDVETVRHVALDGTVLSSFNRPQPGGFVDGLE